MMRSVTTGKVYVGYDMPPKGLHLAMRRVQALALKGVGGQSAKLLLGGCSPLGMGPIQLSVAG